MKTYLDTLKNSSTVVADTGDIEAIKRFQPQDATTNPSLILKAVKSGQYDALVTEILSQLEVSHSQERMINDACDQLIVAMGVMILQQVPGRISTEVNAKLSFDTQGSVMKARQLIALYQKAGVSSDRVLIKLAATWEGIRAAEILEKEGIQCNLTLIFSFAQARACAEAGVYLISPFVGRILDWHKKAQPSREYLPEDEPGVKSVQDIYHYFVKHNYSTVVMGASFRNSGEVLALAGCDRLTISPALLEELSQTHGEVARVLPARPSNNPMSNDIEFLTEAQFRWDLNADAMATEKLAEGIRGFEADQCILDALLQERLTSI